MAVVAFARGRCGEQMFWKNDPRAGARSVRTIVALADAIETIARGDDPRVVRWPFQIFTEIFKDGRIVGRDCGEIVERLVRPGGETRRRDVVAQNSAIHYLREKRRLRNHLAHHVRDVFLSFRRKSLLISRAAAERNYDDFALLHRARRKRDRRLQQRTAQRNTRSRTNKVAPRQRELAREF